MSQPLGRFPVFGDEIREVHSKPNESVVKILGLECAVDLEGAKLGSVNHRIRIAPARLRAHDETLRCDRLRVIGYRARCSCGWESGQFASVRDARAEFALHRQDAETQQG